MQTVLLTLFFILGYLGIIFEKYIRVNKAAVAIIMAIVLWLTFYIFHDAGHQINEVFYEQIAGIAQIIFFLLAAMAIVELIDSHQGFKIVTDIIYTSSKRKMLWFLLIISFFMSAVLDNLTTMIVMISLIRKLTNDKYYRLVFGSMVVIAVNAGGAWTPIGDVTTTMLWIHGEITTWQTMKMLFLPSIVCALVSGFFGTFLLKGENKIEEEKIGHLPVQPGARWVFFLGIGALVMIPVWKSVFGLPPFMGALIGLGALWLVTDLMHHKYEERAHLRVPHVLGRIDTSGVLFFLGILLAIDALTISGLLKNLAIAMEHAIPNQNFVAILIGLASSVIDNVPLVAATMGMYDLARYPVDSTLWQLIAYAAGTGGSILIIGSAAGVAFMGIEGVDFIWYLKKISWVALLGYFAGLGVYFLLI